MKKLIDGRVVQFDELDAHLFAGRSWRVGTGRKKPYLVWSTHIKQVHASIYFHRLITGAGKGQFVDHINGDSLDNRRTNLRIASTTENNRNVGPRRNSSSRFKGVDFNRGRWRARIRLNYEHIELGMYGNEVEAAYAYDLASLKYHGAFGRRNFLPLA